MRLRTTMSTSLPPAQIHRPEITDPRSPTHGPDREHGYDDGKKLQRDAPAHQFLRQIRRTAPHQVDKPEQEHQSDGGDRDGKDELTEKKSHLCYITSRHALRHLWMARGLVQRSALLSRTI